MTKLMSWIIPKTRWFVVYTSAVVFVSVFTFRAMEYVNIFMQNYPGYFTVWYWGGPNANPAEVLRNLGLILVAIVGLPFVVWRSITAHRQVNTANEQSQTAIDNLRLAERGHNNDRFKEAVSLLAEQNVAVASSGVFLLADLVRNADEYFPIVQETLEQYIRKRTVDRSTFKTESPIPENTFFLDQGAAIRTLSELREKRKPSSLKLLDLANTNMDCVEFNKLERIYFYYTRLDGCSFEILMLPDTNFSSAMLKGASFRGADLSNASFLGAGFLEPQVIADLVKQNIEIYEDVIRLIKGNEPARFQQALKAARSFQLKLPDKNSTLQMVQELFRIRRKTLCYLNRVIGSFPPNSIGDSNQMRSQVMEKLNTICRNRNMLTDFEFAKTDGLLIESKWEYYFTTEQWANVIIKDDEDEIARRSPPTASSQIHTILVPA